LLTEVGGFELYLSIFAFISERYFMPFMIVVGSAILINKIIKEFHQYAHTNVNDWPLFLWVLFKIKITQLAFHWGGIRS
jgi:hypothetical protein